MIKFRGTCDKGPLFGFGLSRGNIEKLMQGQPILIDMVDLQSEGQVVIMFGETEESMERELRDAGLLA